MFDKINPPEVSGATLSPHELSAVGVSQNVVQVEGARVAGVFKAVCMRVLESHRALADDICARMTACAGKVSAALQAEFDALPRFNAWEDTYNNVVTTVGGNDMLDKYLAGSAYTATFYQGVIGAVSYVSVPVIGDTAASHATWTEAGGTNAPTYSQGARPTAAWSAAAAKSKALSAALAYSITSTGTLKGSFLSTVATKDATTGVLFSAGLFTGGDKAVTNGDSVTVSYSLGI